MNEQKWEEIIGQALAAPAAPGYLVERVLAKTTRKPSWWVRYKMALAGGVAAVVIAVCVGVGHFHQTPVNHEQFVAYMMSQTQSNEYATFSSDLDLFEAELF